MVLQASGSTLEPGTPVLLGGSWWDAADLCSLARPQALIVGALLALLLLGPSALGVLRALCGVRPRPGATNFGVTDVLLAVVLVALQVLPTAGSSAFGESAGGKLLRDYIGIEGISLDAQLLDGFWLLLGSYCCAQLASFVE